MDWIEIYNEGPSSIDLSGYSLTDDKTNPGKWVIPSGTVINAKGFKVFYADERNTGLHTNFRLSVEGMFIGFYNSQMSVLDSLTYKRQRNNISYGRSSPDLSEAGYFLKPSPDGPNGIISYRAILENPGFSSGSGFYTTA